MTREADFDARLRAWLRDVARDPSQLNDEDELKTLVAKIYRGARKRRRAESRASIREHDRARRERTGRCLEETDTRTDAPERSPGAGPSGDRLKRAQPCYVCKAAYQTLDEYYHLLCPTCATESRQRRLARCDLTDRLAVVTGGRIKVGFELALKLLRDGARVIATTRFPVNALRRYREQPDMADWIDRLHVMRLDLRDIVGLQACIREIAAVGSVDILINNAAQTVSRPRAYYHDLLEEERLGLPEPDPRLLTASGAGPIEFWQAPLLPDFATFPKGLMAPDGQQLDLRDKNSWSMELDDVPPVELLEVHLVNTFSPFLLVQGLLPGMLMSPHDTRYVVNVSAMEGQFARANKTSRHVHTNMAKAGLNMMTRTCAGWLEERGVYMNSVDTGWITQENPYPARKRARAIGFVPPLDEIDGAARVYAPIVAGVGGQPEAGHFYKDFRRCAW